MRFTKILTITLFLSVYLVSCQERNSSKDGILLSLLFLDQEKSDGFSWNLPDGFPEPKVPEDNPMSYEKVELGRHLFYDKRLSRDVSKSCASCHQQERAFTDGLTKAKGIASVGETHLRNAQHLGNTGYMARLNWVNPDLKLLEEQAKGPLFRDGSPIVELGLNSEEYQNQALERIRADELYPEMFRKSFPDDEEISWENILKALAAFERTLITGNSSFDQYYYSGDHSIISKSAKEGATLFFGERAECFHCHGGFNFTDTNLHNQVVFEEIFFHSNGIKSDDEYDALSDEEKGLYEHTGLTENIGLFRAPSLRNVAMTYPYMHDGSFVCDDFQEGEKWNEECARESLRKVIENYRSGGKGHSNIDPTLIRSFSLTDDEMETIIDFFFSLTDEEFINNPDFSNPRPDDSNFGS